MKFLAILKDSIKETIDSKVFYVMVGLSALLALLASTVSFKPKPGKDMMTFAAVPLSVDLTTFEPEQFAHMVQAGKVDLYEVLGADPQDGKADDPSSPFTVTIRQLFKQPDSAEKVRNEPESAMNHIREKFGAVDEMRLVEVTDVRLARPDNHYLDSKINSLEVYFEVDTKPTPATLRLWPHQFSLFFGGWKIGSGALPLGFLMYLIEDYVVKGIGAWVAILVSVIITAFFIPNMLRKGTVDFLLVKPIHRTTLLLYKYVGGLVFIFLNTSVAVLAVWGVLSLRSGIWAPGFLITILGITFYFAILYSFSTLVAVLTRSPIAAILVTCFVWFVLYLVGQGYAYIEGEKAREERTQVPVAERQFNGWFPSTVTGLHYVLPRSKDLDNLISKLLIRDLLTANQIKASKLDPTPISWAESLTVSGLYIAVLLGLSCWRFATLDY